MKSKFFKSLLVESGNVKFSDSRNSFSSVKLMSAASFSIRENILKFILFVTKILRQNLVF